jgi:FAD/FMN-containing dehydrogenase
MSDAVFLSSLHERLGAAGVLTDPAECESYAIDWRRLFPGKPLAVARPANTQEVAAIVELCRHHQVAIVPQGGNTGMAGGAVPDRSGRELVLSLARMNTIRSIDPVGMTMEAEAGVILKTAQDAAAEQGRLLPVSLAAEGSAMIGGIVATNAGGLNVLRYGMTRSLVLGLEVVLPDATIVNGLRHLRKDNAGYDWKQVFIGSEGTLGIVTAAVLRLLPQPRESVTALLSVPHPQAALDLLACVQSELGDSMTACEMMAGFSLGLVEKHFGLRRPIADGEWFVLIEAASTLSGLREATETALGDALDRGFARDGIVAESGRQAAELWQLRERITESEGKEGKSVKHDVSVPIPLIPAFLNAADEALARLLPGTRINCFGHLGDGNLHYNILIDGHSADAVNIVVHDVVQRFGGSISAEHGIGQYRVAELARRRAPAEQILSHRIKDAIDPDGMMNPGKVLPRKTVQDH